MPPVSQAQRAAMRAAKAGHSTLGIPQSVGADFSAADPGGKLPEYSGGSSPKHSMHGPAGNAGDAAPHARPVPGGHRPGTSIEAMTGLNAGHRQRRGRHAAQARKAGPGHPPHTSSTHATPSAKAGANATATPAANSPHTGHITTGAKEIESTRAGHADHHAALNKAYSAGNLGKAKSHALHLANALHKATSKKKASPMAMPSTPPTAY